MKKLVPYAMLSALMLPTTASAQDENIHDLGDISLENLGNIVTSVSKKPEDSFRSAAAIYVITNDDIKASGATHVAEALRGVPGLNVARIDSSNWAISSRGFNGLFANKLLVVVDGRTVYTPLFSGVYWDIQNIPLEDVERIEVIRGPGASLWGANAVNGIINIITKNSADTQGTYVSALAGNFDRLNTDVRYGSKIDDNTFYRVYAKYENRDETTTTSGGDGNNQWYNMKAGFRSDWNLSSSRKITVQGDAYNANIDLDLYLPTFSGTSLRHDDIRSRGMNFLTKWEEKHNQYMQSTFQGYFDFQSPNYASLDQRIYTFDLDYQTSWKMDQRNDVMWGAGIRHIESDLSGSSDLTITRDINRQSIFSAFLQDQYALIPKDLYLTFGSKFEHNKFSGFEIQPSTRLAWYPDNKQTVWSAISRAVRTPSIIERSATINALYDVTNDVIAQQQYNRNYTSEDLIAYEIGYRVKPIQKLSLDTTAFINDYNNLATFEPQAAVDSGNGIDFYVPNQINNFGKGKAYGFETSADWDVSPTWNLLANYSYMNLVLEKGISQDTTFLGQEDAIPHHQFMLRSQIYLPHDTRLINTGYYVSDLSSTPAYFRFDTQVIWKPMNGVELSLVGQNLLDKNHPEFGAPLNGVANEIPRAFYGRVTFRY